MSRTIQAWLIAVVTALLLLPAAAAHARSTTPQAGAAVTDGSVKAIAQIDGKTVLGGDFDYVGEATGAGVPFTRAGVPLASGYPRITGSVTTAVDDGSGGLFVSGSITAVGGVDTRNRWLVHIRADGSFDSTWDVSFDRGPTAMARVGSTLYVAGQFNSVGGLPRDGLAAIDIATGTVTSWAPAVDGDSSTLHLDGTTLYVGGWFRTVAGQPRVGIAAFDTTTGGLTSWAIDAYAGWVNAIATTGDRVITSGSLRMHVDQRSGYGMVAFDRTTGERDLMFAGIDGGSVLLKRGDTIYVGGSFSSDGRTNLAAIDADDGALLPWNPAPDGRVTTLAVVDGNLVAGGDFKQIAGQERLRIAAFDATDALLGWNAPASDTVTTIVPLGRVVYVAGDFSSIGGAIRHNLLALDGDGRLLPWAPNPDDIVYALLADGSRLVAGGAFSTVAGEPRRRLAAFGTDGVLLSWSPQVDGQVYSLLAHGDAVYAGGWFRAVDAQTRRALAAFDRTDGRLLPFAVDVNLGRGGGSLIHGVRGLGAIGDTLYFGGLFEGVNGSARSSLAAVSLRDGSLLPWNPVAGGYGDPIPQGEVFSIQTGGGVVYVGGAFITGARDQTGVAALDPVTGDKALTLPVTGRTWALLLDGSTLYVQTDALRAVDLSTATLLPWSVSLNGTVRALSLAGRRLDVGGDFDRIGTEPTSGYARFLD